MENREENMIKELSKLSKDEIIELFICSVEEIERLASHLEKVLMFLESKNIPNKNTGE